MLSFGFYSCGCAMFPDLDAVPRMITQQLGSSLEATDAAFLQVSGGKLLKTLSNKLGAINN